MDQGQAFLNGQVNVTDEEAISAHVAAVKVTNFSFFCTLNCVKIRFKPKGNRLCTLYGEYGEEWFDTSVSFPNLVVHYSLVILINYWMGGRNI